MGVRAAATAISVVALSVAGVGIWWFTDKPVPDCSVVNEMLSYSESQSEEISSSMGELMATPTKLLAKYEQRTERLSEYPPRVSDEDLRRNAESLVDLDAQLLRVWSTTTESANADSDQATAEFLKAYSLYTAQRGDLIGKLTEACPEAKR